MALTSERLGERRLLPRRRGHHGRRRLSHDGGAHRPVRRRAGVRRRRACHRQRRRGAAARRARAPHQGRLSGPHAGQPLRRRGRAGVLPGARPLADRRQLRCPGLALRRAPDRHLRRHRHEQLLPAASPHAGRGRRRVHRQRRAGRDPRLAARLGPRLHLPLGGRRPLRPAVLARPRRAAARLRPQVRLLALRLQPARHRPAGGRRLRPARAPRGVHRPAPRQPRAPQRRAGAACRPCRAAPGDPGQPAELVRLPADAARRGQGGGGRPRRHRAPARERPDPDAHAVCRQHGAPAVLRRAARLGQRLSRRLGAGQHRPAHERRLLGRRLSRPDRRDGRLHRAARRRRGGWPRDRGSGTRRCRSAAPGSASWSAPAAWR